MDPQPRRQRASVVGATRRNSVPASLSSFAVKLRKPPIIVEVFSERSLTMIDQAALEQGNATYSEIVAEGKRLVDALKELAVEPKQQNLAIVPEGKQIIEALKELAVAVSIYHREQFPEFPRDIGAPKLQFIDLAFN